MQHLALLVRIDLHTSELILGLGVQLAWIAALGRALALFLNDGGVVFPVVLLVLSFGLEVADLTVAAKHALVAQPNLRVEVLLKLNKYVRNSKLTFGIDSTFLFWNELPLNGLTLVLSTARSLYDLVFFLFFISVYIFSSRILTVSISSM